MSCLTRDEIAELRVWLSDKPAWSGKWKYASYVARMLETIDEKDKEIEELNSVLKTSNDIYMKMDNERFQLQSRLLLADKLAENLEKIKECSCHVSGCQKVAREAISLWRATEEK